MEQDERVVVDLTEVNTEQGGEATAPTTAAAAVLAGEVVGAEDKERVSEVNSSVRVAASQSAKKQDLEEPSPESDEVAEVSAGIEKEDGEASIETPLERRAAATFQTLLRVSLRVRPRGRWAISGDAELPGSEAVVLGASSSSAPAPAPGARWAIAHASPRDSYRPMPSRSRKLNPPKRSVASTLGFHADARRRYALPSATGTASDGTASSSSTDHRPPSRSRKQPRSARFIREEAEATARAKAQRSGIALDSFVSCVVSGCPASRSEWARKVRGADDS